MNRGRGDSNRLQHALNVPAEVCCSNDGIIFQFRQGSISSGPIKVQVDYDDLKPYLANSFAQLLEDNDAYQVFKENIKPEPVNPSRQPAPTAALSAPVPEKQQSTTANTYGSGYHKKSKYKGYYHKRHRYYRNGNGYHSKDSNNGKGYYNSGSKGYRQRSFKQGYRSQKRYSGAGRKAGRHGYSGRRHSSRRQR